MRYRVLLTTTREHDRNGYASCAMTETVLEFQSEEEVKAAEKRLLERFSGWLETDKPFRHYIFRLY